MFGATLTMQEMAKRAKFRRAENARARARYARTPVESRAYSLAHSRKNREQYTRNKLAKEYAMRRDPTQWPVWAVRQLKQKCRRNGITFDIVAGDIKVPAVCPIMLTPFVLGEANPQSPSVDRLEPSKGYVRGNVRVISYKANAAKQDITDASVFDRLAAYTRGHI